MAAATYQTCGAHEDRYDERQALLAEEACPACWPGICEAEVLKIPSSCSPSTIPSNMDKIPFSLKGFNFEMESDGLITTAAGFIGTKKILHYDLEALVRMGGIRTIFHYGGSVNANPVAVRNLLIMCAIACSTCCLLLLVCIGHYPALAELNTTAIEGISQQVQSIVPFILALFVTLILQRWWELRTRALQQVLDAFTNICTVLESELRQRHWRKVRAQVQKYGFVGVELIVQAARDEPDLSGMVTRDLLTTREAAFLGSLEHLWQRPMVIWTWMMRICQEALERNMSPPPRQGAVMAACMAARAGTTTISEYMDTQLPFAYVHLVTLLVNIQNLCVAVKTGVVVAKYIASGAYIAAIIQVIGCISLVFLYEALLSIACLISDPFGDNVLTFPIKAYLSFLAGSIDAIAEAQQECAVVAEDGSIHRPRTDEIDTDNELVDGYESSCTCLTEG